MKGRDSEPLSPYTGECRSGVGQGLLPLLQAPAWLSHLTRNILLEIMDCVELSSLGGKFHYFHFTDEQTETQGLYPVSQ